MAVIDGVILKGRCVGITETFKKKQASEQLYLNHVGIEK